ncbi:hypothetical protein [Ruegeria sp. HKCCD8929]|uniref:hypothetical protein n=1 Tax=Ruegeria sp. HKCCD8929 TaxID=2683006 RepID=UPI001488E747|nr:hypothetical protein [Ruegeria sp. HKCCD8929]
MTDQTVLMADERALREMELVKKIIDRHHDARWPLGYHHEEMDGVVYHFANGRYAERAEQMALDEGVAA